MTITVQQLNAICDRLAAPPMPAEFRVSPIGVVAVHDERFYGGRARPWSVVWVPPGHHSHWPTMSLLPQDVASWAVLRPGVS
ncbi:hypothetical protein [Amycolatopsis jejuensis]|uniref:hypothetical protein n=1 Tax=Amycolatopsis jejuensis TaxID=330084 RepID=UPI000525F2A1|nr:hypothetical protein [Amycolatopsis jejuensis]